MTQPDALTLKARHREVREGQGADASIRLHRAISWLARSETEGDDLDARFIFQWVALNAAYARELGQEEGERDRFHAFVAKLVRLDASRTLHDALFRQFSGPIRTLVGNKFVFEPFWVAQRTHDSSDRWEESFSKGKKAALGAIAGGDTARLLSIVFDRLYVLRNQLVHGGATWKSQVNREQLRDGTVILGTIVPLVIQLMLDHPGEDFGEVLYPVI
ncbi:hypothetical protein [Pinirhizobacter sp.]|jgi:hypothetical protein|uniref:hypothetical protein n=1 Tax=Pinirhizobacter sp. TaxID=2950432 RepID=UPI002F3F7A70